MRKYILLLILCLFITTDLLKANPNLIVEHYTVEQGLSNNIVNCTLKGKDGFVWFGTWYGLCSFDGAKFKTYNNREGTYSDLPPRKIQRIVEDKNGALWIKTIEHKLYIFNKSTENFYAVSDDMKDYSENIQIIKIENTPDGKVLLLTRDKSLLRACTTEKGEVDIKLLHDSRPHINIHDYKLKYNIFSESQEFINWIGIDYKIMSYRKGEELLERPADFITGKLAADEIGTYTCAYGDEKLIWLGDKNGKVYSVDPQTGAVNRYDIPGVSGAIVNLLVSDAGLIYLSVSGKGVYEYNPAYGQVTNLSLPVSADHIDYSFADRYEKVWFQEAEKAIVYYDPLNKSSKRFVFPEGTSIGNFQVQDAGEQGLFFLTPAGDMLWFDRETVTVTRMNQMKPFADDNRQEHFFDQMLDEDGILWLSSTSMGVYKVNFPKKQFRLFDPHTYSTNRRSESAQGIRALYQTRNGDIWVGTRWQETYRLDRNGDLRQLFSADNYPIGNVYHITEDSRGNIWFATKGNGLVKAEPDINSPLRFKFTRYVNDPNIPSTISGNDIYFTFEDSKGRFWAGSFGGGLNLMNTEDGRVVFKHKHNTFRNYPPYGLYMEIRNITEDEEGRIWVGTTDGLMCFDGNFESPEDIRFETFRQESAVLNMADNDIYVLYKDASSDIWVSVFGGGLNKLLGYDKKTGKPLFKSYGLREGLNNDVVMSIMEDNEGNLWFATEGGLSRFDSKTEHFRNYDKYDGFFNVEMEESSSMRTVDGEMWLGTKQGILIFSPEKLETSSYNYPTYIVDFRISNRDINSLEGNPIPGTSIKYTDQITLNHQQSMFTIEFAALNYLNQNRVSYRYILDGYEKEWHYNGKNRIASYTNVPPGSYLFYVEAMDEANPDWTSRQTLRIMILPPWWLTWWAYMVYGILALILLFVAIRLAFFMIKMKNDVYIEQKLSELKIRFFTNISHELRTPLTLIKGPLQELKEKEELSVKSRQYVELMEKNTNQMLQLVNQILDFRKIQNGKMRLHVAQLSLNDVVESFYKEFRVLSEEKKITYSFSLADENIKVWADKDKLGIVIRNIISNAFKFTPEGGGLFVSTGISEDGKSCFIRVEDTGVGISQNKLSEIFERFSQADNVRDMGYQGTGIGLALSKEIVNLHHGNIEAESQQGKGTIFTVELQLGKEHFDPAQVDFYVGDSDVVTDSPVEGEVLPDNDMDDDADRLDTSLPSLLIVEDNVDLCNLIKMQLEDKFNILIASNGVEGLKKIQLYHPDIVITDQMMPEMDGLEMLRQIRQDFQISHIPVIVLTAKTDEDAKTTAISMGANAYITKPFSKKYLLARLEQLLNERKLFREKVWQQPENEVVVAEQPDHYEQFLVKKDVQLLEKIHQVIEENMDNSDFNIDTIAANLGLSRSAFFKKLKSLTGLAPVDLVKEIRLNKSVELIKGTDMSISEIAFAVGFKDSGYYSKCFRKKYNQSPREFMNEWRKL